MVLGGAMVGGADGLPLTTEELIVDDLPSDCPVIGSPHTMIDDDNNLLCDLGGLDVDDLLASTPGVAAACVGGGVAHAVSYTSLLPPLPHSLSRVLPPTASAKDGAIAAGVDDELLERLNRVMSLIPETTRGIGPDADCLIQCWVPSRGADSSPSSLSLSSSSRSVSSEDGVCEDADSSSLTSNAVSCVLNGANDRLVRFRQCSSHYQFATAQGGQGLPGRVFASGRPEMSLDVLRYSQSDYLRLKDAQMCGVKASMSIPVYVRDSSEGGCNALRTVASVEVVKLSHDLDCGAITERIAGLLEAVDFTVWGR